ncbi:MAG: UDP-glucuronic acid decarboxylase family protein [Candidatus Hydrothermarchaeaceae archaeon]
MIPEDVEHLCDVLSKEDISFQDQGVLVTGGAGFIGSWICEVLVKQGAWVTCIDNLSSGMEKNIKGLARRENFDFIEHDISQPIEFEQNFDLIMHLASRASPFEFDKYPIQILKANTLGIWVALGIAKRQKARFVYTSTSEVYGDPAPKHIPTPESYNGNVNPVGPRSCYDEAKRAGEAFVVAYKNQHGLDTRIVRIFNTYGPRMRAGDIYGRVVPRFIDQVLNDKPITVFGDGRQTRSFAYVTDQVEGILRLASLSNGRGEVVNIGNNEEIQVIELAELLKKRTASDSEIIFQPLPEDDPKRRCPDVAKAKKLLGWTPKTSLEEGLGKTIEWFRYGGSASI